MATKAEQRAAHASKTPRRRTTGSDAPIPGKCGVKLYHSMPPRYCTNPPMRGGDGRCFKHGAHVVISAANGSPQFLYGRTMPKTLRDIYQQLLHDDEALSLNRELALTRTRLEEALRHLSDALGPACRTAAEAALDAWTVLDFSISAGHKTRVRDAMAGLKRAMAKLAQEFDPVRRHADANREIRADTLVLNALAKTQNDHVDKLYTRITAERAFALRTAETTVFLEALDAHVPDKTVRDAIRRTVAREFGRLARGGDRRALEPAGGPAGGAGPAAAEPADGRGADPMAGGADRGAHPDAGGLPGPQQPGPGAV